MIAVVVGPAGFVGFGDRSDARGGGGMFALRFGTKATDSIQFLIEFDVGAFVDNFGQVDESLENQHNLTTLGLQKYLAEVFWVRGGIGLANLRQKADVEMFADAVNERGLGLMAGLGYDVFRRGIFALDIELTMNAGIYGGAAMINSGLGLGLNWY